MDEAETTRTYSLELPPASEFADVWCLSFLHPFGKERIDSDAAKYEMNLRERALLESILKTRIFPVTFLF